MPRLIRRKPLVERIKDYVNPADFLLWLSEEIETRDLDSKRFAAPLALGLHAFLLIARANSAGGRGDDVFGDDYSGTGWLSYIASGIVYLLTLFSVANAVYTFVRRRHYRLFESSIETPQNTPSAHRVRVDSSPVSSSPLRLLSSILGDSSAESRAHPDPTRDVWEIAVWDPIPICLHLFCLFSPGHVLVYWLFLPTLASDPRPSVTVFTTLLLEILLSSQLFLLQSAFSQQEKDSAIIHKEVMSEYDIKYVHPRLNPLMRDVGTQYAGPNEEIREEEEGDVETYTPTVILKRGFRTNPNPNYAKHVDPENTEGISRQAFSPATSYTPSAYNSRDPTPFSGVTPRQPMRQPQFRQSIGGAMSTGTSTGDGGNLGVYSHANSPLKKAASMYDIQGNSRQATPRNSFDMARQEQRERSHSPAKRQSEAPRSLLGLDPDRRTSAPGGGFGSRPKSTHMFNTSRGPSRF
ncbi:Meiotically up-regulated protein [Lachnellula suecica]|uniref:Meiotically up-regulated protein n=1 Tax=Lachnellula suecica TaxID=602035 RepID=A0A8T9BUM0_9HELO|nr:Meiotically up-regulated protein [Lachnellula suecica]